MTFSFIYLFIYSFVDEAFYEDETGDQSSWGSVTITLKRKGPLFGTSTDTAASPSCPDLHQKVWTLSQSPRNVEVVLMIVAMAFIGFEFGWSWLGFVLFSFPFWCWWLNDGLLCCCRVFPYVFVDFDNVSGWFSLWRSALGGDLGIRFWIVRSSVRFFCCVIFSGFVPYSFVDFDHVS